MSAPALLAQLESLGVRVTVDGERLRVSAAAGQLTDELKARIAQAKPQLLTLLAQRDIHRVGEFPVSFAQRRLWFLDQLEPGNSAYHLGASHRITTSLNVPAMVDAVNDVVHHQSALRTVIGEVDSEPMQVVQPFEALPVPLRDLSHLPSAQRDAEQRRLTRDEATRPFDLARGPLFRAVLLRLADDDHVLLFTVHHIVADGWSLGIFLADLHVAYEARCAGHAPVFTPLPLHYGEHAARERATLSGQTLDTLLAYWRGRLGDASPTLALPTDRPRPNRRSFDGAALGFALSPEVSDGLRALARSERATLYMTLLAAFNVLLHRYSGQRDIVIGTPVANRHSSEIERVIGMFVGILPIRSDLSPDLSWRDLLAQIRENVLEAQAHSALPFEKMVDDLRPERNLKWSPVYQVMFALQNAPLASAFDVTAVAAMVDLSMFAWDGPQGIRGTLEYNVDLFDAPTIKRMMGHYTRLLGAIVTADPSTCIGALPMLADDEVHALRAVQRGATLAPQSAACVHELFETQVRRTPHAEALRMDGRGLTYAELDVRANRLAHHLLANGVHDESLVGIYMERSIDMVVALLAVLKAGAAYVPIDPAFPRERIEFMVTDAALPVVLTQSALLSELPDTAARAIALEVEASRMAGLPADPPRTGAGPRSLAYVIYTSGSTGRPKGVEVEHGAVVNLLRSMHGQPGIGTGDRFVSVTTLSFDIAGLEIFGPLTAGGTVVVADRATALDGRRLAALLDDERATILQGTPATWRLLLESGWTGVRAAGGLKMLCGGEPLPRELADRLLVLRGELWNMYGPTETTIWSTVSRVRDTSGPIAIGRPIAETSVYVLEPSGLPAPIGVAGELHIGGAGVARGYRDRADLTQEKFVTLALGGDRAERVYRTGDQVRLRSDGQLEFVGRRDHQVKLRGYRIELEEIEAVLATNPSLRQCAVTVREDTPGDQRLVAYVVPVEGATVDSKAARATLRRTLPEYMVPSVFVSIEALPLTPNGKVDRAALPEPNVLAPARPLAVEPRTVIEAQLHAILERVLGRSGIGVTDNFFELGGHSLLAVRFFAQIERALGVKLPVSTLFVAPDVAQIARRLQDEGFRSRWSSLVPIRGEGAHRPLFMVPGMGGNVLCYGDLSRLLGPDQPLYGLQARGLDDRDAPFEQIEPMAAHYLSEIRNVQPQGPYRLGGTCFGGVVAYEMARQLRAVGETVELLFMLEAWPPAPSRPIIDAVRVRSHQIRFLVSAIRRNLAALSGMNLARRIGALIKGLKAVGEMAAQGDVYRGDSAHMYVDRVSLANERALSRYRVLPYDGVLRCAIAAQRSFSGDDMRHTWRRMAPRDYAQVELPATDSGTMLLLPCVESLAQWMRATIDTVDGSAAVEPDVQRVADSV